MNQDPLEELQKIWATITKSHNSIAPNYNVDYIKK